jgi:hypothetical protein
LNLRFDECTATGAATLALIEHECKVCLFDSGANVTSVGENYVRTLAAQLQ